MSFKVPTLASIGDVNLTTATTDYKWLRTQNGADTTLLIMT